jgi:hypothetical protein
MVLAVSELELELLRSLPDEMRTVLLTSDDDPARTRLFPRAYSDPMADAEDAEWRESVYPDLVDQRFDALDLVAGTLDRAEVAGRDAEWRTIALAADEVEAWLAVLNDVRLVLGTRLGVTDEHGEVADDDPEAPAWEFYDWLTHLQGSLVETLLGDFDESALFDEDTDDE